MPFSPSGGGVGGMTKIADVVVSTAKSSHTFADLNGDVDKRYIVKTRVINDLGVASVLFIRPNNDTGNNYSRQLIDANVSTISAAQAPAISDVAIAKTEGDTLVAFGKATIDARTGTDRAISAHRFSEASTDQAGKTLIIDYLWHDDDSNITSIELTASQTNGIGVGSILELWAER